jgi:hypothetical protein
VQLFAQLPQRSTRVFLHTYPTPQAAQAASLAEITATWRLGKHTNPTQGAPKIVKDLHRPQLVASPLIVRAKSRLMLSLVKQLLVVIEEMARYDKALRPLFLSHDDQALWRSLPRAGKRLAPRRLAEGGDDRTRSADGNSVQTLAGTAPVPFVSGKGAKGHKRFACLKPLRTALQQFAWQSTRQEGWAASSYRRKRAAGKTHRMALRALANVWVRSISRSWVRNTCSQTATFEAAQRAQAGLSRPRECSQRGEFSGQCKPPVLQRSRPNGSRRVLSADCEPFPRTCLPVQRLPPPTTAFPTPGVGCWQKTTPSQGRIEARGRVDGSGWPRSAGLGLDRWGRFAPPHGRQLHSCSPCFLLFRV